MLSGAEFEAITDYIKRETGNCIGEGKEYLVETRLLSLLEEEGVPSIFELLNLLRSNASTDIKNKVINALTTHETLFFRDKEFFEMLKAHVFPLLIERKSNQKKLTIWSAACSTGQEPYSLVMLLKEHFPQLVSWDLSLYATDISFDAVEKAKEGLYSDAEVNRGLSKGVLEKYFRKVPQGWKVEDDLKKNIKFSQLNLSRPWQGIPLCDVIFIRNVLIYFNTQSKQEVFQRLRQNIVPQGLLFLGSSENALGLQLREMFQPYTCGERVIGYQVINQAK